MLCFTKVVGYKGRAVVVVSCVTVEPPYRPHPHSLVGKEGCKKGVCTLELDPSTMTCCFSSLGVQCVKRKEIEAALLLRQQIRVDPFQSKSCNCILAPKIKVKKTYYKVIRSG